MYRYLLTLVLLLYGLSSRAQQTDADEQAVKELMRLQESRWNAGDIQGFMAYYWNSDSLEFIGSRGITYGWNKTLANYRKSYPDKAAMGILKFEVLECRQLSATAVYVVGSWALKKEKPAGGYFTLLWRKIGNRWLIVSDHTS